MAWDEAYCPAARCEATHLPCEAAKTSKKAGGETTHHLTPSGPINSQTMRCIYCRKTRSEIEKETTA